MRRFIVRLKFAIIPVQYKFVMYAMMKCVVVVDVFVFVVVVINTLRPMCFKFTIFPRKTSLFKTLCESFHWFFTWSPSDLLLAAMNILKDNFSDFYFHVRKSRRNTFPGRRSQKCLFILQKISRSTHTHL